jgi:hypothetical protein
MIFQNHNRFRLICLILLLAAASLAFVPAVHASASCAFNYLDTHQDVTPSSGTTWQDVDVSTWVPSGATGVILQVINSGGSPEDFLVRKKVASSPDAYVAEELEANAHAWPMVGIDSNRVFQAYAPDWSSTGITIYLIGYTGTPVTFFDNRLDVTPASTGSWLDADISSDTGADTAIAAIVGAFGLDGGASTSFGMRKNGSTDVRYATIDGNHQTWGIVGVDGSEIFENRTQNTTSQKSYVYGYVTSGIVMFDNAVDHSATSANYEDADITSDLQGADDANGAVVHFWNDSGQGGALRKNGDTHDRLHKIENHQYGIVAIDTDYIF